MRFCKTCRYLKVVDADGERLPYCMFWVEFTRNSPQPEKGFPQPTFQKMNLSKRLVFKSDRTPSDLVKLGHDHTTEDLTESMDCPTWRDAND